MNRMKFRVIVGVILGILLLQTFVFADMEVPDMKPYNAVVSNPDGAPYIDIDTHEEESLPYGTKVRVEYEDYYSPDGQTYASCFVEGQKNKHFELSVKDLSIDGKNEEIVNDLSLAQKAILLSKSGAIEMKKGPAEVYDRVEKTIPSSSEVTLYQYSYEDAWAYVEYQGQRGWINTVFSAVLLPPQFPEIIILEDTVCSNYQKNSSSRRLPENTIINSYYESEPGIELYLKEDDGTYSIIPSENVGIEESGILEVTSEYCNIYQSLKLEGGTNQNNVIFSNIAIGTRLSYKYHNPFLDAYYVEYDGIFGWVYGNQNRVLIGSKESNLKENTSELVNNRIVENNDNTLDDDLDDFAEQKKIIKTAIGICIGLLVMTVLIKIINRKD